MITVIVEHFLTKEGQQYFPEWITHVKKLLEKNSAFVSISKVAVISVADKQTIETHRSVLELKFSALEALKIWVATEEHKQILELLNIYTLKSRKTIIYGDN